MRARAQAVPDELFERGSVQEPLDGSWASERPSHARPKVRKASCSDRNWELLREQAAEYMANGDWSEAIPRHYVAAYALLHKNVYGVEAAELTPSARVHVAGLASRMLKSEFAEDRDEMALFLRWTWAREKWRRAARPHDDFRITPRYQFSPGLVTAYRVAAERERHARGAR